MQTMASRFITFDLIELALRRFSVVLHGLFSRTDERLSRTMKISFLSEWVKVAVVRGMRYVLSDISFWAQCGSRSGPKQYYVLSWSS